MMQSFMEYTEHIPKNNLRLLGNVVDEWTFVIL